MHTKKIPCLIAIAVLMVICLAMRVRADEKFKFLDSTANWDHVKSLAAEGKKLIFVDCSTEWCSWCKKMEREVFPDPKVSEFMNRDFIGVRYDMEVDFGITLAMKYRINAYPTFLVLDQDGTLIYREIGYQPADKFVEVFSKNIDPANRKRFVGISTAIDPGFPPFYRDAFLKGDARKYADSTVVDAYLASVTDLSSETPWSVMHRFMRHLGPKYTDYILQHVDQLKSAYGDDEVDFAMADLLGRRIDVAIKTKDEAKAEEAVSLAERYLVNEHRNWRATYMQSFYVGTEQWGKAVDLFEKSFAGKEPPSPPEVNEFSWNIYEKCDDAAIVRKATGWMKDVVTKAPDYASLDTYAALLYKAKEYKDAESWALKAIDQAKIEKSDFKETQELLEKIKAALGEK
jgi:thioredoxin-related protein